MICYEVNGIQLHMYVNDNRGLLLTESSNAKNLLRRRIRWGGSLGSIVSECIFYIYCNLLVTILICMLINISGENVAIHSIDKFILSIKFKYFMNKNSNELLIIIVGLINRWIYAYYTFLLKSEDGIWES